MSFMRRRVSAQRSCSAFATLAPSALCVVASRSACWMMASSPSNFASTRFPNMFGNLVEAKLLGLDAIIQQADRLATTQSAEGASVANALHDLWADTRRLMNDIQNKQSGGLLTYLTPMQMNVSQISTAIYGDATHGVDIMS